MSDAEKVEIPTPVVNGPFNPSVDEAKEWIRAMGRKGIYTLDSARFRVTALDRLGSIRGDDEPNTARWFLESIDELAGRYGRLKTGNPETIAAYQSRARTSLEDFFRYLDDPARFKSRAAAAKKPKPKVEGKAETKAEAEAKLVPPAQQVMPIMPPPPPVQPEPVAKPTSPMRTFPLGNDKQFTFALPEQGISAREVVKLACHILTFAEDFDPTNPDQAKLFLMARGQP